MFISKKAPVAPDVPPWGRRWSDCLSRGDGAGANAAAKYRGGAEDAVRLLLRAAWRDDGQVDAGDEGRASSSPRSSSRSNRSATRSTSSAVWRTRMSPGRAAPTCLPARTTPARPPCFSPGRFPSAAPGRTSACRWIRWPRSRSARTRRCRRWSCRSKKPCSRAKRHSAAPIAIRSRGSRRRDPLPMQNNPRLVFEKLFGDGSSGAERRARRQESRSLLDSVMGQMATLQKDLAGRSASPHAVPGRCP